MRDGRSQNVIREGDRVGFCPHYLARVSDRMQELLAVTGTVIAIEHVIQGLVVAHIEWDRPALPSAINVYNLRLLG